jgi:hypothetical protein
MAIDGPDRKVGEVTRRALFGLGISGAAAGVTVLGSSLAEADDGGSWLIGTVDSIESDQAFYVKRAGEDGSVVRVELVAGATVWRGGAAVLTDFDPGEDVGADGEWREDGSYAATTVEGTLRRIDADVRTVEGETLVTDEGKVVFSDSTRADVSTGSDGEPIEAEPLETIGSGDRVMAVGRRNAAGDELQAYALGTYK